LVFLSIFRRLVSTHWNFADHNFSRKAVFNFAADTLARKADLQIQSMNRSDGTTSLVVNDSCSTFFWFCVVFWKKCPGILHFSDLLWVSGRSVPVQPALLGAPGWVVLKSVAARAFVLRDPPLFSHVIFFHIYYQ
jgi:hypothetical protein